MSTKTDEGLTKTDEGGRKVTAEGALRPKPGVAGKLDGGR
jgi:hypothetical protein